MHSELFHRWRQALHDEDDMQRQIYQASMNCDRGLGPQPSESLHVELERRRRHCRKLLHLLLDRLSP